MINDYLVSFIYQTSVFAAFRQNRRGMRLVSILRSHVTRSF
jgi:hypothetical protein